MKTLRDFYQKDKVFEHAIALVINKANEDLDSPFHSVMEKTTLPPSASKHDYQSLARYWWPDEMTKSGRPYIRKDGIINPEIWSDAYDYDKKCKMTESCQALSLAYFFTGDERYAQHAAAKIKTWFLNPSTLMNPNLNFAQGIPGKITGRAEGIIESSTFPLLFDTIRLLEGSPFWSVNDQQALENWIKEYLNWLLTSPNGIKESQALNNHGTWYDFQVIYFALYTHQKEFSKMYLNEHVYQRLRSQINLGSQEHELVRTRSFFYCCYNLHALFWCALLGEQLREDVWDVKAGDQGALRSALDWMISYSTGEKPWIKDDIEPINAKHLAPLLLMAACVYQEPKYLMLYHQLMGDDFLHDQWRLFYPAVFWRGPIAGDSKLREQNYNLRF